MMTRGVGFRNKARCKSQVKLVKAIIWKGKAAAGSLYARLMKPWSNHSRTGSSTKAIPSSPACFSLSSCNTVVFPEPMVPSTEMIRVGS